MRKWWEKSTIYQIYPLSFNDSNDDGYGDIKGITEKLEYIKELGIDIIWLSPVYQSPMDDNGYDISDYYNINPLFGTMEDFDELLNKAHNLGLKIIMDLVINHTSDEHPWFIEAKKSKENKYRDYYIWRDPINNNVPSSIQSVFSGSAWEYDSISNQYYFHLFSKKQPDLNWDNPDLRKAIYDMINWWLDKGIDGFRLDVIDLVGKDIDNNIIANGEALHDRLHEMYVKCFKGRKLVTIGETPCANIQIAKQLTNPKNEELDMIFSFQHISLDQKKDKSKWELAPLDIMSLKQIFNKWQKGLNNVGWNSLFWCNHDQPRIVSRLGNDNKYRVESAKMLATLIHFMQGTPFVYQGEEIGMTNVKFIDLSDYRDIETLNMYKEYKGYGWNHEQIMSSIYSKGRDNARTPMQWNNTMNAGFTNGKPWIKVNPNFKDINVENAKMDSNSLYSYYQKLIRLRKEMDIITYGNFEMILEDEKQIIAYTREYNNQKLLVVCNLKEEECSIKLEKIENASYLIGNYNDNCLSEEMVLRPYECFVYELNKDVYIKDEKI